MTHRHTTQEIPGARATRRQRITGIPATVARAMLLDTECVDDRATRFKAEPCRPRAPAAVPAAGGWHDPPRDIRGDGWPALITSLGPGYQGSHCA